MTTATVIHAAGIGFGIVICAQSPSVSALPPPVDSSMPTTIVGAFIALSLAMMATQGWVIKWLCTEVKDGREKYANSLDKVSAAADLRADKLATAIITDNKETREQQRKEREQHAELSDRDRQQRAAEHEKTRELLDEILTLIRTGGSR